MVLLQAAKCSTPRASLALRMRFFIAAASIIGIVRSPQFFGRASLDGLSAPWLSGLTKRVQKRFRRFEIGRVKAFGKPAVHRPKGFPRVGGAALIAEEAGEAAGLPSYIKPVQIRL
jgi:hypothetical protein